MLANSVTKGACGLSNILFFAFAASDGVYYIFVLQSILPRARNVQNVMELFILREVLRILCKKQLRIGQK